MSSATNRRPFWMQDMVASGYRSVEVDVPRFNSIIKESSDCEECVRDLMDEITDLAVGAMRVFLPEATYDIAKTNESYKMQGWPRGLLLERHVYAHGKGVRNAHTYARIRLQHGYLNPREGEGYSITINLWGISKLHYEKVTIKNSNPVKQPRPFHISGDQLNDEELDGLVNATGAAFRCTPQEIKRID